MAFPYDARVSLYSDELARQSIITFVTGGALDTYGVERLVDDSPAHLFRGDATTIRLQFDHQGERAAIALLALIHATTEADDDVLLEADDAADWVTPSFSAPFPQAGWMGAGLGRWPLNPVCYPTQIEGYDPYGYLYHSLVFGKTTALAQNLELGNIRMHPDYLEWAMDPGEREQAEKRQVQHETSHGVETKYPRRADKQHFAFTLGGLEENAGDRASLKAHWADVEGPLQPFVFVEDATVNQCHLVCYDMTSQEFERQTRARAACRVALKEKGRGLRPGGPI